jgi:hypothetical protein
MAVKREKAEQYEGHGDGSKVEGVTKGQYMQVGSVVPVSHKATSVNTKSGHEGAGREGA